jgi:hypothetical protein
MMHQVMFCAWRVPNYRWPFPGFSRAQGFSYFEGFLFALNRATAMVALVNLQPFQRPLW